MFKKQLLFGILCFLFSIPFISAQNFPDAISFAGLVVEGTLDHTTTEWSTDQKMIYTINWVKIKSVFQGQTNQERLVPVLSEGGAKDEGLLVVSHAWAMHLGYDYLLALEPCENCITGMTTYQPIGSLTTFNEGAFIKEKNKWQNRPNVVSSSATIPCKGAFSETDELFIRFSNIHITDVVNKLAYIDIQTRTTQYAKPIEFLSTEIEYDSDFFGLSVISNSVLQMLEMMRYLLS